MSRRNLSSRSASSPKVEEKVCLSFSSCSTPGKGPYSSSHHLKPISLAKNYQVLKPKKLALGMPPTLLNAASNITHSAIADQDSSRVTTTFNVHCTVQCAVGDFNVNFAIITTQSRYNTVPYCVHDTTCRSATSWIMDHGTATSDWGRSAVHYKVV